MTWVIYYKYINGEYVLSDAGSNIIPTDIFDKTLPVEEHVARQAYKLYYDGEVLRLKEGETLLSLEELNAKQREEDILNGLIPNETVEVPKIVEVVI